MSKRGLSFLLPFSLFMAAISSGCGGGGSSFVPPPDNPPGPPTAPAGSFVFARAAGNSFQAQSRPASRVRKTKQNIFLGQPRSASPRSVEPGVAHIYLMDHQG